MDEKIKQAAMEQYCNTNQGLKEIAEQFHISRTSLYNWLLEEGIPRKAIGAPRKYSKDTIQRAIAEYKRGGTTLRRVAAKYHFASPNALLYYIKLGEEK